ncbi:MAG: hypothetical protein J6R47_03555 [Acholeplasmatales bacterium]|nr:hypothetical protein [Acholeplasmatales bacterium]
MIDIAYDNREMVDLYLLFKKREDIEKYLAHEISPQARFRACDYVDYHTDSQVSSSGVTKKDLERLTIKTNAMVDFNRDDWIYDVKSEQMWKVVNFTLADDGQMKEYSLRPRKITILELIRR